MKNIKITLISSTIVTIAFAIISLPIQVYRNKKSKATKLEESQINILKENLILSSDIDCYNILSQIIDLNDCIIKSHKHITSKDKNIFFIFCEENQAHIETYNIIKNRTTNNIVIYCISKNIIESHLKNINNLEIEYIEIKEIYNLLSQKHIQIKSTYNYQKITKFGLKSILCVVLSKDKSRNYLLFGLLLLFSSLFTPYSIYYIVMSTILILFAIISRFNTWFN